MHRLPLNSIYSTAYKEVAADKTGAIMDKNDSRSSIGLFHAVRQLIE